jgi:DNA-binding NtrC family response regulator
MAVLVIDPSKRMRRLFTEALDLAGNEAAAIDGIDSGFDKAADIEIVLVDVMLGASGENTEPDTAGLSASIRERWPSAEIVYLVDSSQQNAKRKLERGRLRHLSRPFQIEELQDLVAKLFERRAKTGR